MTDKAEQSDKVLFNRSFLLICLASLFFFVSYHLLSPVLPLYWNQNHMDGFGIGMLLASFMVASLLLRPWVGKWADETCKIRLMNVGVVVFAACPVLYLVTQDMAVLHLIRIIHGASFALFYTASGSYLTDSLPDNRKAEGISYYSNAIKLAMAFSPGLGILLAKAHYLQQAFWLSCLFGVFSIGCIALLPRTHKSQSVNRQPGKLFNKKAVFPGVIMASNALAFGALIPFASFLAVEKHISMDTVAWFYTVYAAFLIMSRWFTGRISDQHGRDAILIPGLAMVALSLGVLYWATEDIPFLAATALYGLSAGTVQPSLMALAVDSSSPQDRGSMMATFTMLTDFGIALGSFIMGSLSRQLTYTGALLPVVAAAALGWVLFMLYRRPQILPPTLLKWFSRRPPLVRDF